MLTTISTRKVIEGFVAAEKLRGFVGSDQSRWVSERVNQSLILASLTESELHSFVNDKERLARFCSALWTQEAIPLEKCWVWPEMRGWVKASGRVPDVAGLVIDDTDQSENGVATKKKLLEMAQEVSRFAGTLPLIAFAPPGIHKRYKRTNITTESWYDLDDGSSRAVAIWLAGQKEAFAFVGDLRSI
jgi:hypothetical protein